MTGDKGGKGILDRLREETSKHEDWLFVLGTFVCGSEDTGVACFNHTPGKWMTDLAPSPWKAKQNVMACPQCHALLQCGTCKGPLTVLKPNIKPPQYWDSKRNYWCPKCSKAQKFQERVKSVVIDNYALVQKGGFSRGDGINDYCMQKELVSNLDFEKLTGSDDVKLFGANFETSEPPIGGAKERMGGGVFTMDGITFGMEICLDHLNQRLKNSPDAKNILIQLIPSAGMDIKTGSVACVNRGLLFNVDGGRGDAVVKVNPGLTEETRKGTVSVPNCAMGCFPDAANQSIEVFGPFDIPYV
jgi:hypothetical protein